MPQGYNNFMANNSPWIHQLNHDRVRKTLDYDVVTDVTVVGAGIAGISTAFYLLKQTDKSVVLLESYKLAHGATGHNAGQLVSYFEKPFKDIVAEFGLEMACEGQKDIYSAWTLLEDMYTECGLDIPKSRFESYGGLSTLEQILRHLENNHLRRSGGLYTEVMGIWEGFPELGEIPEKYHQLFTLITREEITLKLETFDPQYIAVLSSQKGVMNSALFCQEVVTYLLEKYPQRFSLYEHAPVKKVVVHDEKAILDVDKYTVECGQVVLCTNGFENIEIITPEGLGVNSRFHHNLEGVINFMSGYLEPHTGVPAAISYFSKEKLGSIEDLDEAEPYFYVTRRSYEYEKEKKHNLICVGGPETVLEHRALYDRNLEFSEEAKKQISDFICHTYDKKEDLEFLFTWHGVMGYTKNLIRMIGPDPICHRLYYNLGCNGVGLLPSIFGGSKVARQIGGERFEPSIFDVPLVLGPQKAPHPEPVQT